ncbi:LysR family transcriptional regulator [Azospirillum picis]|uniref:DNA-binding transcriptional LysR family regulator n=1 Tax=Azospirillum picis TaxID=488438 RepID=A0ABU0MN98_9PROT|nr:LysR family transcriptional regulator [Azospirillum picis]MBP2300709.1 DNA-binding transcriptional LysR family regulator [Azospirillum picis]MDQ0534678.1 DNA-binding transcriptional LysR family regulator [Azospirillum picis]
MELRQVRCFVAVAEELHFRRAAERLAMAQAALSHQVRLLEEEMGCALLFRTTRQVSLTAAGIAFLAEGRRLLEQAEQVLRVTRAAAGAGGSLRIGGIDQALVAVLPPVLARLHAETPELRITLTEGSSSEQEADLVRHRIDLAFLRPPVSDDGLACTRLFDEPFVAAVPEGLAAEAGSLPSWSWLAGQPLIGYPRHSRPLLHDLTMRQFAARGCRPQPVQEVTEKLTMLQLVGQGIGIALVPRWLARFAMPGVAFRPLPEAAALLSFGMAWRRGDPSPALAAVRDAVLWHRPAA